jgi:hypothetical protein
VQDIFDTDQDRLAALQVIDRELKEKRDLAAFLLGEIEQFGTQLAHQREEVARLSGERATLEARRADLDARLETEGAKIRDHRMRMNRIRNERELLALQHQVNVSKELTKQLEDELLLVMETLEGLAARLGEAEQTLQSLETVAAREIAARRERAAALTAEVEAERGRREAVAQGLERSLRSKYEQIFSRRGGTAVVEVRNGTCQGCHMHVPPQLFNELQKFRDVRQCPSCHRILYWRPEPQTDASAG